MLSSANLDKAWESMEPFMGSQFIEEMEGLAEGAGVPLELLKRVHMIPAVSEYSCSGVAIWGKATRNGHLYQIRNLDYTTTAHLQDFRSVVVYIPKIGIPHINPSFAGNIGCHTGMNQEGITLTEIGDSPASDGDAPSVLGIKDRQTAETRVARPPAASSRYGSLRMMRRVNSRVAVSASPSILSTFHRALRCGHGGHHGLPRHRARQPRRKLALLVVPGSAERAGGAVIRGELQVSMYHA